MAIFYRCDRCKKELINSGDLAHFRIELSCNDEYDRRRFLNRTDMELPVNMEICRDCCVEILKIALTNKER